MTFRISRGLCTTFAISVRSASFLGHYNRCFAEPLESELAEQVEYDMDEQGTLCHLTPSFPMCSVHFEMDGMGGPLLTSLSSLRFEYIDPSVMYLVHGCFLPTQRNSEDYPQSLRVVRCRIPTDLRRTKRSVVVRRRLSGRL